MPKTKKLDIDDIDSIEEYATKEEEENTQEDKDQRIITKFSECFTEMKWKRTVYEADRDIDDGQMEANTYYDENWILQVNPPLEQSLVELASGRMAGKMNYNLESIGKKPIKEDSVVAKHALAHFIRAEKFHKKIKEARYTGWVYWTVVYYTWVIATRDMQYRIKEWVEAQDAYWSQEYDEYEEIIYEFTGKNVPLREFRLSADGLNAPDIHRATKAVMKESMDLEEAKVRFWNKAVFRNVDKLSSWTDPSPAYWETFVTWLDQVQIYYYFDRVTKDFYIISNEDTVHFSGKYHGKKKWLPFESKQHYTNHKSFYGYGICNKVRYLKAYKAEMLQDLLGQSKMWWPNIIAWNNNTLSSEYLNNPWEVNVRKFSGDVDKIKTFQYAPDIQKYASILQIIDDLVVQDTWENLRATYEAVAPQLGTVEIIENARATRLASVDENDDTFLGEVLTAILDNITQYAPKLLTETVTDESGIKTVEYPVIQVKDMKVEEEQDGYPIFVEDMGEQGYFEFRDEMVKGRYMVKVTTNSNVNTQKTLEKNSIMQMINNYATIASFAPELIPQEDIAWLLSIQKQLNGFDEKYDVDTSRDKLKKEAMELINNIQNSLWLTQFNDPNIPQDPTTQGMPAMQTPPGWNQQIVPGSTGWSEPLPRAWATLQWEMQWVWQAL